MIVVSDNSVLSCLAEMGELDLLRRLYGKITVTETIRREAMHGGAPEDLRRFFGNGALDKTGFEGGGEVVCAEGGAVGEACRTRLKDDG